MKKNLIIAMIVRLALFTLGGMAYADSVPINNPSFEMFNNLTATCGPGCHFNFGPIPGWQGGGTFQPNSQFFSSIPDGSKVAFTNGGTISQMLTSTVLPDTVYTMTAFVGNRLDGFSGTFTLALDTIQNGVTTTLCTVSGNALDFTPGTFESQSCMFTSGSTVPGGDLYLLFTAGHTVQLDVDDVSLTTSAAPSVPEPSSLTLVGLGVIFLLTFLMVGKVRAISLRA